MDPKETQASNSKAERQPLCGREQPAPEAKHIFIHSCVKNVSSPASCQGPTLNNWKTGVGWVEDSLLIMCKALLSTHYRKTTGNTEMTKGGLVPKELWLSEYRRSSCLSQLTAAGGSPDDRHHP